MDAEVSYVPRVVRLLLAGAACAALSYVLNRRRQKRRIPLYIMLPLDTISSVPSRAPLQRWLTRVRDETSITGVSVDVWWGVCEPSPACYDWSPLRSLFRITTPLQLKVQAIMSFHACGGNVGDDITIPLPAWVRRSRHDRMQQQRAADGQRQQQLWYCDEDGHECAEYISLWATDDACLSDGRTPATAYADFMSAFAREFATELQDGSISHVCVGCGPCGEARYPSYSLVHGWKYPEAGRLQCYGSAAAKASWRADQVRHGVSDSDLTAMPRERDVTWPSIGCIHRQLEPAACDCSIVADVTCSGLSNPFLSWYASCLTQHVQRMISLAQGVLPAQASLMVKLPGIHWHTAHSQRRAETAAGLIDADVPGGGTYAPLLRVCARAGVEVAFTCVEMRDELTATAAMSRPFTLARAVMAAAAAHGVELSAENALYTTAQGDLDTISMHIQSGRLHAFTFLRLSGILMNDEAAWNRFAAWAREQGC